MTNLNDGLFYFKRAETNFNNQNYENAIILYSNAIENFTAIHDIRNYLSRCYASRGYCYFELGNYNYAIHDFEESLKINRNNDKAWLHLGLCYFNTGDMDKTKEFLTYAVELNQDYLSEWYAKALLFIHEEDFDSAEVFLLRILMADPDNAKIKELYTKVHLKVTQKKDKEARYSEGFASIHNEMVNRGININDPSNSMLLKIAEALLRISIHGGKKNFMILNLSNTENLFAQCVASPHYPGFYVEISGLYQEMIPESLRQQTYNSMLLRGWGPPERNPFYKFPSENDNFYRDWENDSDLLDVTIEIFETLTEIYEVSPLQDYEIKINLE